MSKSVKDYVRSISDFPEEGVLFRDITPVIQDPQGFRLALEGMQELIGDTQFDVIVAAESRGFLFGAPLADRYGKGVTLLRKKGKLPWKTVSQSYELEYGSAEVEMHEDAILPGQKVLIVDDLIATGGTVEAAVKLVEKLGGEVVMAVFLMELTDLKGRERLKGCEVKSVIKYEGK
ncbi:adenine phosphoribosyltransferase [Eubacterium oxidoreducens]|uniref:Adenine phosphoribosyltransferase n=1 Tax=Eubacterium oxidoreducens TaxID=1732 RepID=A0A1G6AB30_EUBOX|nr:adenine phosphoribosyltransferase [Eubacterium oxidoreducens]SDB05637.1 adenine phosphoribosyltransferase [Eubacterium oxidoreducens]